MYMFARIDENPAMTLQGIKETKRYGRTHGRTDGCTDGQRENSIPSTNKVCGGYNYHLMQVKRIAEGSKGSILQYFQPSLSYHLSLRSMCCLFSSGHFTQVLFV